jgi:hypothetical protein
MMGFIDEFNYISYVTYAFIMHLFTKTIQAKPNISSISLLLNIPVHPIPFREEFKNSRNQCLVGDAGTIQWGVSYEQGIVYVLRSCGCFSLQKQDRW